MSLSSLSPRISRAIPIAAFRALSVHCKATLQHQYHCEASSARKSRLEARPLPGWAAPSSIFSQVSAPGRGVSICNTVQRHPRASHRMFVTNAVAEAVSALSAASTSAGSSIMLYFTPATAALGGALLGLATAGKLLLTGRVLGISGAIKGLTAGDAAPWRFAFLLGMGAGSVALGSLLPTAFETLPATFPLWRAALAGLLVGVGSALGNGCTSGHGICGSARLSTRSFAYTATFMASGMATATATGAAAALAVAPLPAALLMPSATEVQLATATAAAGIAAFVALAAGPRLLKLVSGGSGSGGGAKPTVVAMDLSALEQKDAAAGAGDRKDASSSPQLQAQQRQQTDLQPLELGAEMIAGGIFALGLGLSGMTRPSKVAGFLTLGVPSWDASLPFVMGGAVVVAAAAYQGVQRFRILPKPLLCDSFQIPSSSLIDTRLLVGGVLFGAGWGLAGMCPGPALVAALQGDAHVLSYVAAMAGGMLLEGRVSKWMSRRGSKGAK